MTELVYNDRDDTFCGGAFGYHVRVPNRLMSESVAAYQGRDISELYTAEYWVSVHFDGNLVAGVVQEIVIADDDEECAYCNKYVRLIDPPPVNNDAAWAEIAQEHEEWCEWVQTRAHRR